MRYGEKVMSFAATSSFRRTLQALILLAAAGSHPCWAATFVVNSTLDATDFNRGDGVCETASGNGVCTLRAAIQETNRLVGPDIIQLPADTYVITIPGTAGDASGNLDISDDLTITGAGAQTTIVDGGLLDNVFSIVGSQKTVFISGVTIQNGSVSPATRIGGGIFSRSSNSLTLTDVVVRNNHAGQGAGIYNQGNLTLIRTVVEGNTAVSQGGGISHSFGLLTVSDSTIRDNTAVSGGGIFSMGPAAIESSTVSGNLATNNDAMLNNGDAGGGIVNGGSLASSMTITNSTISGNRANGHYGGVYSANGDVNLNNVTVAGNVADADGDGFGSGGGLGLNSVNSATATLRNSIVASNQAAGATPDCSSLIASAITSSGYNLIGDIASPSDCVFTAVTGDQVGTGASVIDPGLKSLSDYGGPTQTRALMLSSPAVDAGDPSGCSNGTAALAMDQRGMPRASDGGSGAARCDIGAYEVLRPIANAGPDQRVNSGVGVSLDGSGSSAPGSISSYVWTQLTGATVSLNGADTASPSFTAPSTPGVLQFQLSVTDNFGTSATDTVDVTVNAAPSANAGADQTVSTGSAVALDGSASSDADGSIVGYSWMQVGGAPVAINNPDTATPNFTAPGSGGTLVFQLTVTDNDGATGSASVAVTVSDPVPTPSTNIPPVAKASADKTVSPHSVVFLNGWKSYDPDGKIVSYQWRQTGGPRVRLWGAHWPWAAFVAPSDEGSLTFQLTVTDNKGATSTDSVTVTVDDCTKRWYHFFFKKHRHRHGHECR
jgi:CSLREA domain-containing protein